MPHKFKRQPKRPASVDDGIKWLTDIVAWRVKEYYKVQGNDNRAKAGRWYDSYFAYEAARRLTRLLLWKARHHAPKNTTIKIRIRMNPPALVDVRQATGPADLIRRQQERPPEA